MGLTAPNGDVVTLMVHETTGSSESERQLAEMRVRAIAALREDGRAGWRNQRALFAVVDREGMGNAIEIAVPDDRPDRAEGTGDEVAERRHRPIVPG
jgi:hypothetical protein